MKKIILFVFCLFLSANLYSQITLGPKIGYNASLLSTNISDVSTGFMNGYQFGAFLRLGKTLYLQPELIYSSKGGIIDSKDVRFGTIDIPVIVGYKIIDNKLFNIRLLGGLLGSIIIDKDNAMLNKVKETLEKSSFNDVNFGLLIGAGADLSFLTLDIKYEIGLNDIYKNSEPQKNWEIKNYQVNLSLGVKLLNL